MHCRGSVKSDITTSNVSQVEKISEKQTATTATDQRQTYKKKTKKIIQKLTKRGYPNSITLYE